MTERWEQRLRDLHVEAPPEMWRRVQEGSRNQPPLGQPPRRVRLVAAVVALAVFAGAGVFAWRAFGPTSPAVSSAIPTPSSGLRVYTDPFGWTASYPADSLVFTTGRTSDGLATAVTFVNRVAALQQGPTQDYVMLRITHALYATADPSAGSSAFPLSASDFKPVPGPVDFSLLDFTIDGVRYSATLRVGASASKADIAAMDALIASIRPSATTSSAVVRSDGRTFRCTVTFPQVPLTPGAPPARFSACRTSPARPNRSVSASTVTSGGWCSRATARDCRTPHGPTTGSPVPRRRTTFWLRRTR